MFVRSTFLAAAALGAAAIAAPAVAQAPDSVSVGFSDLNLSSQAGREAFGGRVAAAARLVCGEYQPLQLKLIAISRACQARAVAAAEAQLGQNLAGGNAQLASLNVSRAAN
jgi:UrcA family protein